MKTRLFTALMTFIFCFGLNGIILANQTGNVEYVIKTEGEWTKSTDGVWIGKYKGHHKFEGSKLMASADGKDWYENGDAVWTDKQGRVLKFQGGKLFQSPDGGSWTEASEPTWQGGDDKWYKLDSNGVLWVKA